VRVRGVSDSQRASKTPSSAFGTFSPKSGGEGLSILGSRETLLGHTAAGLNARRRLHASSSESKSLAKQKRSILFPASETKKAEPGTEAALGTAGPAEK